MTDNKYDNSSSLHSGGDESSQSPGAEEFTEYSSYQQDSAEPKKTANEPQGSSELTGFLEEVRTAISDLGEQLRSGLEKISKKVEEVSLDEVREDIKATFSEAGEELKKTKEKVIDPATKDKISRAFKEVKDLTNQASSRVKEIFAEDAKEQTPAAEAAAAGDSVEKAARDLQQSLDKLPPEEVKRDANNRNIFGG